MKRRIASILLAVGVILSLVTTVYGESAYGDLFSEYEWETAYEMAATVAAYGDSYDFNPNITESVFDNIIAIMYNQFPELFIMNHNYKYSTYREQSTGRTMVGTVYFLYNMDAEEEAEAQALIDSWRDGLVAGGDEDFTELEWALYFHDALAGRYHFDDSLGGRTMYDLIATGTGVCRAYHLAYIYLLRSVGVEASFAASTEMAHVWSMVKVDGEWYHVDVLWDDGVSGAYGRAGHRFFMLSDKDVSSEDGGHYAWYSEYTADAASMGDSVFGYADSAFTYKDGLWYYMADGNICVTADPLTEGQVLYGAGLKWPVPDSAAGATYKDSFSGLFVEDGGLFFNDHLSVYRYDLLSGSVTTIYTVSGKDGSIFGFYPREDGSLVLSVSTVPSAYGTEHIILTKLPDTGVAGDANGDGRLMLTDAALIMKYAAGWGVIVNGVGADANSDGRINLADASFIMRKLAGWAV